ncbi:MAG: DUF86 domain-containing protein [Cyanobacteria bacterium P01_C01_bin.147]
MNDILVSCDKILRYTAGLSFDGFIEDERTFDAVVRNLQLIGEAVKNLPDDLCDCYPEMEWRKIAGLRNILVHAYFTVENEIIWDVVQSKIPNLKATTAKIQNDLSDS